MQIKNYTFLSLGLVLTLACNVIPPCHAEDTIDEKSMAILDAVATRYSGAESIEGKATMVITQTLPKAFGGGEESSTITHSLARKGAQFSQIADAESEMPVEFYVDGEMVTLKLDEETVIQGKNKGGANAALLSVDFGYQKEAGANMILDQHLPAAFMRRMILNDEKYSWKKKIIGLSGAVDEVMNEVQCHKMTITSKQESGDGTDVEMTTDVWVAQGDEPRILRIQPDMTAVIKQMAETNPDFGGIKIDMVGTFSKPVIGGEIPAEVFQAELGKDVKKFESFAKLIEQMQSGQNEEEGGEGGKDATSLIGTDAADFELDLLDGAKFKLSDHMGKVVVLDFWATWCGPCVQALPVLMKVSGEYADKGVKLIAVNQQENKEKVAAFLKKNDWKLTVAMDTEGKAAELFLVRGIPQTVIVGKDGKIKQVHIGFSPGLEDKLAEELKEALGE